MAKDKDSAEEAPKKGKKKLLIIIVAAVIALGGGGAGGYFFFAGGEEVAPAPEPGEVVALESITVNLADGHYLKLRIALQATAEVAEVPDGSKALDIAIEQFSNKSIAELSSDAERNRQKGELREKISKAYDEEIMDVYFTEFVMQ